MGDEPGPREGKIILYSTPDGAARIEVHFEDETFWLTLNRMAELFGTTKQTISYHLQQIFDSGELKREGTVKGILTVQREGARDVRRPIDGYILTRRPAFESDLGRQRKPIEGQQNDVGEAE